MRRPVLECACNAPPRPGSKMQALPVKSGLAARAPRLSTSSKSERSPFLETLQA